jgi:hypothetical protein
MTLGIASSQVNTTAATVANPGGEAMKDVPIIE